MTIKTLFRSAIHTTLALFLGVTLLAVSVAHAAPAPAPVPPAGTLMLSMTNPATAPGTAVVTTQVSTLAGTSALNFPIGMAWDGKGTLYIADSGHNQIVTWRGGVLSNFTKSTSTTELEDVVPSLSGLNDPFDVKLDAAGNVYIADTLNHTIRVVNMQSSARTFFGVTVNPGHIQTVLGIAANSTSGLLTTPKSLAFDPSGNLIIGDSGQVLQAVPTGSCAGGGCLNILVGTGASGNTGDGGSPTSAKIGSITGLAFDSAGILYISDVTYGTVRAVNLTASTVTYYSASTATTNTPSGPTTTGGPITLAAGTIRTVVNGVTPGGVLVDANRNLYVADETGASYYIRTVKLGSAGSGVMSNYAGNGNVSDSSNGVAPTSAGLGNPQGLAADGLGNIYASFVTNSSSGIRIIGTQPFASNQLTVGSNNTATVLVNVTGSGQFSTPAIVGGATGEFTITSNGSCSWGSTINSGTNCSISVKFTPKGPGIRTAQLSLCTGQPGCTAVLPLVGIGYGPQINVLPGAISRIAGTGTSSGSVVQLSGTAATSAGLNPTAVAFDPAGNMYILDQSDHAVVRLANGSSTLFPYAGTIGSSGYTGDGGAATSAKLSLPLSIAVDAAGNLYIADNHNSAVRKVDVNGTMNTVGSPSDYANAPISVAVDPAGNLFVGTSDGAAGYIYRRDAITGVVTAIAGNGTAASTGDGGLAGLAALKYPQAMTVDAYGNLYVADGYACEVRKINLPTGMIYKVAGTSGTCSESGDGGPATSATLLYPAGIAVDPAGNVYISDQNAPTVRLVSAATGLISTIVGTANSQGSAGVPGAANAAQLGQPAGLAFDSSFNLYITDMYFSTGDVLKVTAAAYGLSFPNTNVNATSSPLTATAFDIGNASFSLPVLSIGDSQFAQTALAANTDCVFSSGVTVSAQTAGQKHADSPTVVGTSQLAPGQSCNLNMTFRPTSGGAKSSQASFTPVSVPLSGTGNNPATSTTFNAAPTTSTYGQSVTFTVAVTSNSAAVTTGSVTFVDTTNSVTLASNVALDGTLGTASFTSATLGAGTHAIQATYNAAGTFTSSNNSSSITVAKKALTVTATVSTSSATYGSAAPTQGVTVTGFVNNDNSGGNGTLTTTPGTSISIGGAVTGQVAITVTNSGSQTVTLSASSPAGGYTLTPSSGTSALTSANYSFSFSNGSYTINKAGLTVTANTQSFTYGGTVPTFDITAVTFSGFQNGDTTNSAAISGNPSFTFQNSVPTTVTISSASPAGTYTIIPAPGSLTSANYTFVTSLCVLAAPGQGMSGQTMHANSACSTSPQSVRPSFATVIPTVSNYVNGTLTINKKTLTVTGTSNSMVYGATPPSLTVTFSGFVNSDNNGSNANLVIAPGTSISNGGSVTGQALLTITNSGSQVVASFASNSPAGSYTLAPSSATSTNALTSANYTFSYSNGSFTVFKAGLTVTANPQVFTYGGTPPTFDITAVTITGFQNSETQTFAAITGQPGFTFQNSVPSTVTISNLSPAGSYTIIPSIGTLSAANYTFVTRGCGSISPESVRPLGCPTGVAPESKHSLVPTQIPTLATYVNGTLTINKAPLTVQANGSTVNYGAQVPSSTYTITGFVNGETTAVISGAPIVGNPATSGSPAGTYQVSIAIGSLSAANYFFNLNSGSTTINRVTTNLGIIGITPGPSGPVGTTFQVTFLVQSASGGGAPSGTVTYTIDGGSPLTATLGPNGTTVVTYAGLPTGKHTITDSYNGDNNYFPVTSTPFALTVALITPSLGATVNNGVITVSVTPASPAATGTVSCSLDGGTSQLVTLTAGSGTVKVPTLTPGSHSVTCSYSGDSNFAPAAPFTTTFTVAKLSAQLTAATSFTGTSVPVGTAFNVNVGFTLPSGGPSPTGTITYAVDGGTSQTATLVSGGVSFPLSGLTAGSHTVAINYAGDTNYGTSGTTLTFTATSTTPLVPTGGLINGALTTSNISPGALASIFGANLATSVAQASSLPLPTTMGGVTVTINGKASPLLYVSATQINFQVPYETALGQATVVITTSAGTGAPFTVTVTAAAPAIFTYVNAAGNADPVILHATTSALVTATAPALPGETLTIYATGAGPVNNTPASGAGAGAGATSTVNPTITVGTASATVSFSGLSQGSVGLFQINFTLPATLPAGSGTPPTLPLVVSLPGNASPAVNLYVSK